MAAGMRDPGIGRVLALLHEKPEVPWTLERLADDAAMSRSTLTGRVAEPDEIAATVAAIADAKLFGYTTGQVFAANGGMYLD